MPFVDELAEHRAEGVVAGPSDGTGALIIVRQRIAPGERGWLHRHDGDQIMRVVSGSLLIAVGDEERRCERGAVAVIPPSTWHGFVGGEHEALLEVIGSVGMHTYFATRAADGTIAAREVHRHGVPWDTPPPAGLHTTAEEMGEIVAGTIASGPASAPV